MKNLILSQFNDLIPKEPEEQVLRVCSAKMYGALDVNSVLEQYKYCIVHNLQEEKRIFYEYLFDVIGNQIDSIGG